VPDQDSHAVDQPVAAEAGDGEPVDPRYMDLRRMGMRIFAAAAACATLLVVAIVVAAADDLRAWIAIPLAVAWLIFVGALVWHAERWPALTYPHLPYRAEPAGLAIRHGVYWRNVMRVPRSRIQHTDVSQGPLERRYGLGTLVLYTAGTTHARVALPGLGYDVAVALRDRLKPGSGEDAV